jgi:S-adenosylmethionine:tRNA ribosyltransferase-isomerase
MMALQSYDFELPSHLEAREPAELRGNGRDDVRLLVTRREDDSVVHAHFRDFARFLRAGDLVVLNTTATLPAAVSAVRDDGEIIALHFSTPLAPEFIPRVDAGSPVPPQQSSRPSLLVVVEPRGEIEAVILSRRSAAKDPLQIRNSRAPAGDPSPSPFAPSSSATRLRMTALTPTHLHLPGGVTATLLSPYRDSRRLWIARIDVADLRQYLMRYGRPITYSYIDRWFPIDAYQTVFAESPGSAEMPSAGRAFTRRMLVCLRRRGVRLAKLVLHAGVASLEAHERPYEEYYEVPPRTAAEVRRARERGGRVVAVGTTVVRALESSLDANGQVVPSQGWTDLVITPDRRLRAVDALLTGLHEPRATHLAMLEALAGRDHVKKAYAAALEREYLWHEFGDLHLIV